MRLVIVDDQALVRDALRKACFQRLSCTVVGEAGTGSEAIAVIRKEQPEVVILDLRLPDMSGFEVVKSLREFAVTSKFLALTAYCDDYTIVQMEQLGLHGFIDKSCSMLDTLWHALTEIRQGRTYFVSSYLTAKAALHSNPSFFMRILSDRECAVLSLIGLSFSDVEIAQALGISIRTAQTHRSNILHKLNIENTPKLILFAIEHGLVSNTTKLGTRLA